MTRLLAVLLALAFILPACKKNQTTTKQKESKDTKNYKPLLYEISGNSLQQPSYLFGTIHVIDKEMFSWPDVIDEKLKSCQILLTEVDLNLSLKQQMAAAERMMFKGDTSIKHHMSAEDFARFDVFLRDSLKMGNMKYKQVMKMKPIMAEMLIIQELLGDIESYDLTFNKKAKKFGLKTGGLESLDFQISLLDSIPIEEQIDALMAFVDAPDEQRQLFDRMVDNYIKRDVAALYNLIIEESEEVEIFHDKFIVQRNHNWIPVIEQHIKKEATFIAVGAGHLGGPDGILKLLEAQGYTLNLLVP